MNTQKLIKSLEDRIAFHYRYLRKNKGGSMCEFYKDVILEDIGIMYMLDLIDKEEFERRINEVHEEGKKE